MSDQIIYVEGNARHLEAAESLRIAVPAQSLEAEVVTVKTAAKTAYTYCVRAARRFARFITVKASAFAVVLESRVRAFLKNVFPKTGADILRQSAILNI